MSSVEYLCGGTSALEGKISSPGFQAEADSKLHHFKATPFVVMRKYGGSSGADPLMYETSQRTDVEE